MNRAAKTRSSLKGSGSIWILNHTESYGYDANPDYLTSANYGDGLPNATPSWTYDAAANRTDTVADNLNRPVSINGVSATSDILGNRLTLGSQSYGWDCLNRMTSYGSSASYAYRADGMRVSKNVSGTTTKYFYDGQMGMEDQGGTATFTDYGLGARGVDYISRSASGVTTVGFPVYDAQGNMTACLFRSGSSYTIGNQRSYDAWGVIRSGTGTGDPKGRYCASLGHKQDDESSLVYMRARYYEPGSGRFISEDPSRSGINFLVYATNDPVNKVDQSGKASSYSNLTLVIGLLSAVLGFCIGGIPGALFGVLVTFACYAISAGGDRVAISEKIAGVVEMAGLRNYISLLEMEVRILSSPAVQAEEAGPAGPAIEASANEVGQILGTMIVDTFEDGAGI